MLLWEDTEMFAPNKKKMTFFKKQKIDFFQLLKTLEEQCTKTVVE